MAQEGNATDVEPRVRFLEGDRDHAGTQSVVRLKTPRVMARPHLVEALPDDDDRTLAPSRGTP